MLEDFRARYPDSPLNVDTGKRLAGLYEKSESWSEVPSLPLVAPSSDFVVMKLHLEAMAAAKRNDAAADKRAIQSGAQDQGALARSRESELVPQLVC